jgi:cysteine desulfurase/selenocysteine lyase
MTATAPSRPIDPSAYDVAGVRADFPIFTPRADGRPLFYLDTAASAQKPRQVIDRMSDFNSLEYANIHRGAYQLAAEASVSYEGVRRQVAAFLGARTAEEIVFTHGTTEGINLVAQGWGHANLGPGDEVLITEMEHHANIVPWHMVAKVTGATVRAVPVTDAGELDMEALRALLTPRVKLVAVTHLSNVLGTINPVAEIAALAHAAGALVLVDGAQSVAHLGVDVQALGCDFLVFSGHKLYGPTGTGVLWARASILSTMSPMLGGGGMIEMVTLETTTFAPSPTRFEAGTQHITGVIGLGAALRYLEQVGLARAAAHEHALLHEAVERLGEMRGVTVHGSPGLRASLLSFSVDGVHPHDIATVLDEHGVAIRAGHHCAQPLMRRLGVPSTARASFGCYSTRADIDALVGGIQAVQRIFG